MNMAMMRMSAGIKVMAMAATLVSGTGALDVGPFVTATAMAQIKNVEDIKTLTKPELPPGALEISVAMKAAKIGETITIRGNVAMSKDAFVENRAVFTLVDESTRNGCCPKSDSLPETSCDIPAQGRATVQIVGTNGKPFRSELHGEHGLKPGAEVFVTGKVEAANGSDTLVVTVVSMHVPKAPLPTGFFAEKEPDNAKDVSEVRKAGTLKVGDEVVLRGRIGGSKEPFVAGRAVFTLVGRGIKACNENPDDKCSVPWDYCCETRADILAHSVTVQVVDTKERILRTDMKGRHGLKELSEVVVVGNVASTDGNSLVLVARGAFVAREDGR